MMVEQSSRTIFEKGVVCIYSQEGVGEVPDATGNPSQNRRQIRIESDFCFEEKLGSRVGGTLVNKEVCLKGETTVPHTVQQQYSPPPIKIEIQIKEGTSQPSPPSLPSERCSPSTGLFFFFTPKNL